MPPAIDWSTRIAHAHALAAPCQLCQIRCGVDRAADERGRCGLGATTPIYARMLHFGEEHHLIPSYIVSLSGCSMHCTFCSEDVHLRPPFGGQVFSPEDLARALKEDILRQRPRARNINFVGGEPSISLPFLLETARALASSWPRHPPLLLNTNGYLTSEALALCQGVFPLFVFDLKFGDGDCGWRIGKVKDYFHTVSSRLLEALDVPSPPEVVVRHLLMPGHMDCCTRPVLEWFQRHLASRAILNVMPGFVPFQGTRADRFWSEPQPLETLQAFDMLRALNLDGALWDGLPLAAASLPGTARA